MAKITLTEGLAEIKIIEKRLGKKGSSVLEHLVRSRQLVDPLIDSGGSPKFVAQEMQAIFDLGERIVSIRRAISRANQANEIEILGKSRTIADWLTWRRDVYPGQAHFYERMLSTISNKRRELASQRTTRGGEEAVGENMVVHYDEGFLLEVAEDLETVFGKLDGLLSMKNAQIEIEVP